MFTLKLTLSITKGLGISKKIASKQAWMDHLVGHRLADPAIRVQAPVKLDVVYFDQLSGAACTRKLVNILFSAVFNLFLLFKHVEILPFAGKVNE